MSLVNSRDAWSEWLARHADDIAKLAAPESEAAFRQALAEAADASSTVLVRRAMKRLGVPVTQEMDDELLARSRSSCNGAIDPSTDSIRTAHHLQVLRVMLVALLAKHVGYDGDIVGWQGVAEKSARLAAAKRYQARVPDWPSEPADELPLFSRPGVPTHGLIAGIASFAQALTDKTGGDVLVLLHPVPRRGQERAYELKAFLPKDPGTRIVLFTVLSGDEEGDSVVVRGWTADDIVISDNGELQEFLRSFARSREMRDHIERLMILADELRRGEFS
jgi:hypothetical protein